MTRVGVIAFAFGQQADRSSGPSNDAIAKIVREIRQSQSEANHRTLPLGASTAVVTQWEVAIALQKLGVDTDCQVSSYGSRSHYLTSKQVLMRGLDFLCDQRIHEIVLVAHPLHLRIMYILLGLRLWRVHDHGFKINHQYDAWMKDIPYDTSEGNTQWWTRRWSTFLRYLLKTSLTRQHGK